MVPTDYTGGMYNASLEVFWGDRYKIEDVHGTQGKYRGHTVEIYTLGGIRFWTKLLMVEKACTQI